MKGWIFAVRSLSMGAKALNGRSMAFTESDSSAAEAVVTSSMARVVMGEWSMSSITTFVTRRVATAEAFCFVGIENMTTSETLAVTSVGTNSDWSSLVSEVASYLVVISAIASPVAEAVAVAVASAVEFAEKALETVAAKRTTMRERSTGVKALVARLFSVMALSNDTSVSSESSKSTAVSTTMSC